MSQIDYVICLVDATNKANIIQSSIIKYKKVTRSVLGVELYEMADEFDIEVVIKATVEKILGLAISLIP